MRIQGCLRGGVVLLVLGAPACSSENANRTDLAGSAADDSKASTAEHRAGSEPSDSAAAPDSESAEGDESPASGAVDEDDGADFAADDVAAEDSESAYTPAPADGPGVPGAMPTSGAPVSPSLSEPGSDDAAGAVSDPSAPTPPPSEESPESSSEEGTSFDTEAETDAEDAGAEDTDRAESVDAGASEEEIAEEDEEPPPPPPPTTQAGLLTAGVWDDNRNLDRFLAFRKPMYDGQLSGLLDFDAQDHKDAKALFEQQGPRDTLDIALVIDTTGSMGDEMEYLQTEIRSISMRIEKVYPEAEQRWALVVYRDVGDEYIAQTFDFDSDPEAFRDKLADQSVGGGGDFPEAPDAALAAMNELSWRDGSDNARLAFWVADAPHHAERAGDLSDAVTGAQGLGVHIYPVASSGIDEFTELAMRSTAQLTGGRYIFLTSDSGVGGEHKEPSIPCYFVTRLDVAMLRMVNIEMSGEYQVPADNEIVRKGGNPKDGACELSSGDAVFVF